MMKLCQMLLLLRLLLAWWVGALQLTVGNAWLTSCSLSLIGWNTSSAVR